MGKKAFFVCDWDFTIFWEKISKKMLAKASIIDASALVVGRNFYEDLIAKSEIPFKNVYLLQDKLEACPEHIENLEQRINEIQEKYNESTLWRFVTADRSWCREDFVSIRKRLVACFDYFEELFEKENPDIIFTNAYASMPHLILYVVAKKMNIPIYRPMSTRLGSHWLVSDNAMEEETWIQDYLNGKLELKPSNLEKAKNFLNDFRTKGIRPSYQVMRKDEHAITMGHFFRFFRYVYRFWLKGTFKGDHTKKNPLHRIYIELAWRFRRKKLLKNSYWETYNEGEKYVFFPLHVQPEMSTMTFAPYYLDQISIIENLAKSLHPNYRLIVKEHPSMLGIRSEDYYERLKKVPSVKMVPPHTDSHTLIKNADLIFTITGTAALEGMLYGRPVTTLGSVFFNQCPLVTSLKEVAPTLWEEKISHLLKNYKSDEEVLLRFLASIFERSIEGLYIEPLRDTELILGDENLERLIDKLEGCISKL